MIDTNLLAVLAKIQQDIHLTQMVIETLQVQIDDLMARLQKLAPIQSIKFTDLEGIWEESDLSFETVQTAEFQISEDLLFCGKI